MRTQNLALSGLMACLALSGIVLTGTGCAGNQYHRSTGAYLDDKSIAARVKTALFRDPAVSGFDVHVNSFRGDVQLSGFVDTPEQRDHAAQIAQSAEGVRLVTNNLEVKPATALGTSGSAVSSSSGTVTQPAPIRTIPDNPPLDNSRLAPAPANTTPIVSPAPALSQTPAVNQTPIINPGATDVELPPKDLDIKLSGNGTAIIRGRVSNEAQRQSIERHVREMPGVTAIDNRLEIKAPPPIR